MCVCLVLSLLDRPDVRAGRTARAGQTGNALSLVSGRQQGYFLQSLYIPDIKSCDSYVHRVGRTARAGQTGTALSLVSAKEHPMLKEVTKLYVCIMHVKEPY